MVVYKHKPKYACMDVWNLRPARKLPLLDLEETPLDVHIGGQVSTPETGKERELRLGEHVALSPPDHALSFAGYVCPVEECGAVFAKWSDLRKHAPTHPKGLLLPSRGVWGPAILAVMTLCPLLSQCVRFVKKHLRDLTRYSVRVLLYDAGTRANRASHLVCVHCTHTCVCGYIA